MREEAFNLYGMRIIVSGDVEAARRLASEARRLMFQTKLIGMPQKMLRSQDGSFVHVLHQAGMDFARIFVPTHVVGEKKYKKSQKVEILPYLFASENSFDRGGVLVCLGGLDFSGGYELLSPYGDVSAEPGYRYQPEEYTTPSGETLQLDRQIKEYYDPDRAIENKETGEWNPIFWNEFKWMTGGMYRQWDPTFYETYIPYSERTEKPHNIRIVKSANIVDPDLHGHRYIYEIKLDDEVLSDSEDYTWWYDVPVGGTPTDVLWNRILEVPSGLVHCIDQENRYKNFYIYTLVTSSASVLASDTDKHDPEGGTVDDVILGPTIEANNRYKIKFVGLGHDEELGEFTEEEWSGKNCMSRMYNINDQYICLFSIYSETLRYVGSAVEGGDFNLVDVSGGIEFEGESRELFTDETFTITMGMILRQEPESAKEVI